MTTVTAFTKLDPPADPDVDFYIQELDKVNRRLDRYIEFIEVVEALTFDQFTARRIRCFLQQEGIWLSQEQKD